MQGSSRPGPCSRTHLRPAPYPGSPVLPPGGCALLVWEVTLQASSGNMAPKADSWSRLGASPSWHPTQRWHRGLRLHPSDSRTGPHTRSLLLLRMAGATGGPAGQTASWSAQDVGSSRPSDDQARHQTDGLSLRQVKGDASPSRHFEPRRVPASPGSVSPSARGGGSPAPDTSLAVFMGGCAQMILTPANARDLAVGVLVNLLPV